MATEATAIRIKFQHLQTNRVHEAVFDLGSAEANCREALSHAWRTKSSVIDETAVNSMVAK